jgi:glycine/D-amino acid oxidase-like deaminating enzyme
MSTPLSESLWTATARPAPDTPALEGEARADVVVVGGGFTGLSAALHLAEAGTRVALLEAEEPGWGGSGRNGGQVIPGYKYDPPELAAMYGPELAERMTELAWNAPDLVFALIERHGIDCQPLRAGWLQLAHAETTRAMVERRAAYWQGRGVATKFLDRQATAAILGVEKYFGACLDPRGGCLNPLGYARGLADAAQRAGALIHGRSPARAIERSGGAWRVTAPGGSVIADRVVLCTNAYTDALWPGLQRTVIPLHSLQVATKPLSENLRRTILPGGQVASDTQRILFYYRLDPEGRLVMGGRGTFADENDPGYYRYIENALRRLFPRIGEPQWEFRWAGKVALTVDVMPHLHAPAPGVWAALGYNGRGVAMATRMGKLLADLVGGRIAERDCPFPITGIKPIPFFALRRPALAAITHYYRLRDALGR